jgi:uncharacterized membrane protein YeaQ/YmgE (transglycosylase-associated protein family)
VVLAASVTAGTVIAVLALGLITGGLARLAIPGPDPMPIWLTIAIGLVGSFGGGAIAYGAGSRNAFVINTVGFVAAIVLVALYRKFVQKRPLTGPEALRFPKRGLGVEQARQRLQRAGIDPDAIGPLGGQLGGLTPTVRPPAEPDELETVDLLGKLVDLHEAGVLTDEEYEAKRNLVVERARSDDSNRRGEEDTPA